MSTCDTLQKSNKNTTNKKKTPMTTIFSNRLAGYLMLCGFVLINIADNTTTNDGSKVFFFVYSPQLKERVKHYQKYKEEIIEFVNK